MRESGLTVLNMRKDTKKTERFHKSKKKARRQRKKTQRDPRIKPCSTPQHDQRS